MSKIEKALERFNSLDNFYTEHYLSNTLTVPLSFYMNRHLIKKYLECLAILVDVDVRKENKLNKIAVEIEKNSNAQVVFPKTILLDLAENDSVFELKNNGGFLLRKDYTGQVLLESVRSFAKEKLNKEQIFSLAKSKAEKLGAKFGLWRSNVILELLYQICYESLLVITSQEENEITLPDKNKLTYLAQSISLSSDLKEKIMNLDNYYDNLSVHEPCDEYLDYCLDVATDLILLVDR